MMKKLKLLLVAATAFTAIESANAMDKNPGGMKYLKKKVRVAKLAQSNIDFKGINNNIERLKYKVKLERESDESDVDYALRFSKTVALYIDITNDATYSTKKTLFKLNKDERWNVTKPRPGKKFFRSLSTSKKGSLAPNVAALVQAVDVISASKGFSQVIIEVDENNVAKILEQHLLNSFATLKALDLTLKTIKKEIARIQLNQK